LEESIRSALDAAKAKGDNTEFPATRLKKILDNFAQDNIRPTDKAMFHGQVSPISEIIERYIQGLKEHEINVTRGTFCPRSSTTTITGLHSVRPPNTGTYTLTKRDLQLHLMSMFVAHTVLTLCCLSITKRAMAWTMEKNRTPPFGGSSLVKLANHLQPRRSA
jgi:Acetyl-CoA carboxylase, central region